MSDRNKLTVAVTNFSGEMLSRLHDKMDQGYHGWESPEYRNCVETKLKLKCQKLVDGDVSHAVDVANLAMILKVMDENKS